jgi:hypothetical protein
MWFAFPVALLVALTSSVGAESFAGSVIYSGGDCSGTPLVVSVVDSTECEPVDCLFFIADAVTYSSATTCESTDREKFIANAYTDFRYVVVETFTRKCKLFMGASAYVATDECQVYDDTGANYFVASVNDDGSASVGIYNDSSCTGSPFIGYTPDAEMVSSRSCYRNYSVIYTGTDNSDGSTSSSSGSYSQAHGSDSTNSSQGARSSRVSSNAGSFLDVSVGSSGDGSAGVDGAGSKSVGNSTVTQSLGGVSAGALVGIIVAYVLLSMAACVLCMDRMERVVRQLGLWR